MSADRGQAFLDEFLPAAGIDLARLSPPNAAWLEPWLDLASSGDGGFVLPVAVDRFRGYYAGAPNPEQQRRLAEALAAFVGASHGHVGSRVLDPADPLDAVVAGYTGAPICLTVAPSGPTDEHRRQLQEALDLMRGVLTARPAGTTGEHRPLAAVLRDFEWALHQQDPERSVEYLTELEQAGLLSLQNLRFLEVRRLAALDLWAELRSDERFTTMVGTPLPRGVADLMLEAIYRTDFSGVDLQGGAAAAGERFSEEILPRFGPLFRTASRVRSPGAVRLAMLFAATRQPPRTELIDDLLGRPDLDGDLRADLEAIGALAAPAPEPAADPLVDAAAALQRGEADLVFHLLADVPPGPGRAALLVEAAFNVYDLEASVLARGAVEALSDTERAQLPTHPRFERMLAYVLRDGCAPEASTEVTGWPSWLDAVQADPAWSEAFDVANRGADEWEGTTWLTDRNSLLQFVEALSRALADERPAVRQKVQEALGPLIRFAGRLAEGTGRLNPILEAVRMAIVLDDRRSPSGLELVLDVTERQLLAGVDTDEYRQVVGDLLSVWKAEKSPERLDWAMSALDLLSRHRVADTDARHRLLVEVGLGLRTWARRCSEIHYVLFDILAAEYGVPEEAEAARLARPAPDPAETEEAETPWRRLDGTVLGVYCLLESAAKRIKELVLAVAKPDRVVLNDSHHCSQALKSLAQSADFLLVVTQHSKHQAVRCITENATPGTRVVTSSQSRIGATGLVRTLADALREEAPDETEL